MIGPYPPPAQPHGGEGTPHLEKRREGGWRPPPPPLVRIRHLVCMAGSCGSRGIAGVRSGVCGFSGIVADRPAGPGGGRGVPP